MPNIDLDKIAPRNTTEAYESCFADLDALNAASSSIQSQPVGWSMVDTIESMAKPVENTIDEPVKKRGAIESLRAMFVTPEPVIAASNNVAAGNAVDAVVKPKQISVSYETFDPSDSYVEKAVDEIVDWAGWVWNAVNPWNDSQPANNQKVLGDEPTNPFANGRRALSPAERAKFREATAEMNKLFEKLRELLDDDQFEAVMQLILMESVRARKESGSLEQDKMIETYKKKMKLNKERLAEANKVIETSKRSKWWGQFEEVASSMGLSLAALMATGSGGWGVVAMVYAAGNLYSHVNNHAFEKGISKGASYVANAVGLTSKGIENDIISTLKIGSGVVHGIMMFSLGGWQHWLGTLLQGTMQIVSVNVKVTSDRTQGRLYKIDEELKEKQGAVSGHVKKIGKGFEAQTKDQTAAARIATQEQEVSQEVIRGF
ncbi:MAG: hypothetical protein Q8K75_00950 [Chlamydiales bacterium]|nr:hypothetical protein [Chlamydiales bacterium]